MPKKILIVDDEMDMRIFMSTLFKTSGFQPIVCRDGKEGLAKAKSEQPDIIILDVMMPNEGGVHMYRHLKTDDKLKSIPVIMLSAVGQKTFSHYLHMLQIRIDTPIPEPDAYIEKPPSPEQLLDTVKKILMKPPQESI